MSLRPQRELEPVSRQRRVQTVLPALALRQPVLPEQRQRVLQQPIQPEETESMAQQRPERRALPVEQQPEPSLQAFPRREAVLPWRVLLAA